MAKFAFSIVVDDAHLKSLDAITRAIGAQGLQVDRIVPEAGAIRAIGEEGDLEALRRIEGVLDVTCERGYQLPPMDEKIPQ